MLVFGLATVAHGGARLDYTLNCMGCHRTGGEGAPPDVPMLKDRVGYYLSVPGGRDYLVQVPGSRQSPLTDAQLADVLNYIISEFGGDSVPTNTQPYSTEEVARLRIAAPEDIDSVRVDLEARIEAHLGQSY